jgi:WD40 repeat protein
MLLYNVAIIAPTFTCRRPLGALGLPFALSPITFQLLVILIFFSSSLEGHEAMSEYALAWNKQAPKLLSGGSDNLVVLWNLEDYATSLFKSSSKSQTKWKNGKSLQANRKFKGHTDTVEDVAFHPTDHGNVFCSVGDDRSLIIWDARVDDPIAIRVSDAHEEDINCVDWNSHDPTAIVSGSSDGQ